MVILNIEITDKPESIDDNSRHRFKVELDTHPVYYTSDPDEKESIIHVPEEIEYYCRLLGKWININFMQNYFKKSNIIDQVREFIKDWVDEVYNG